MTASRTAAVVVLALSALGAALPTAASARRKHRRPGCGKFCQQAGPSAGGYPLPAILLKAVKTSRGPFRASGNAIEVAVACHLNEAMTRQLIGSSTARGCVGDLFLVDGAFPNRHNLQDTPEAYRSQTVGAVDLDVPVGESDIIDIPLNQAECTDLRQLGRIGEIELQAQLRGRVYFQDPNNPRHRVLGTGTHQDVYAITTSLLAGGAC